MISRKSLPLYLKEHYRLENAWLPTGYLIHSCSKCPGILDQ